MVTVITRSPGLILSTGAWAKENVLWNVVGTNRCVSAVTPALHITTDARMIVILITVLPGNGHKRVQRRDAPRAYARLGRGFHFVVMRLASEVRAGNEALKRYSLRD